MSMDTDTKTARRRLLVLQLAAKLGNAAEACRRLGLDRTSFYEWRRRFRTQGLDGLKDHPPIHKNHAQATTAGMAGSAAESVLKIGPRTSRTANR